VEKGFGSLWFKVEYSLKQCLAEYILGGGVAAATDQVQKQVRKLVVKCSSSERGVGIHMLMLSTDQELTGF